MPAESNKSSSDDRDDAGELPSDPPTLQYAAPGVPINFKTLKKLPAFEANLAAAKLEAEGVNCFVADQHVSVAHPVFFGEARLQVAEADFERARQILETLVSNENLESDARDDGEDAEEEYVEEAYRCPKCRRKDVDLLPVSKAMRHARAALIALVALPLALRFAEWTAPKQSGAPSSGGYPPIAIGIWIVAIVVLAFIVFIGKRRKRCRSCKHEWGHD